VHLNDHGRAQAAALGRRLAQTRIDAIYASPLERTVETAQAVLEHHPKLRLETIEDLGEVRYGDWTGGEIQKLVHRKMWEVIQHFPSRARFPNGETMRQVQARAVNVLESLIDKHPRSTVALVSHSDVIKMIVAHFLGMHLDLFQRIEISPASLTILAMGASRPVLVQLNETTYLPRSEKEASKEDTAKQEGQKDAASEDPKPKPDGTVKT
jgi:probable phosphoglycerate mutase